MNRDRGWHSSIIGVLRRTYEAAHEDNISFLASGLAFDVLLTAIPFIVLLLAVIGYLVQHQVTTHQYSLEELLARFLPAGTGGAPGVFETVESALKAVVERRGRLTLVGVPLFLWFSMRFVHALRVALNDVFDTDETRRWHSLRLVDLFMVAVAGVYLVENGLLSAYQARYAEALKHRFLLYWMWSFSVELIAFGLGIAVFYLVFKLLPSRRINWRTALVAATFCSLGFEVVRRLYALYITRFFTFDRLASDANVVALFLFLLWIYYSAFLFLWSGELAETYDLVRMRRAQQVRLG